MRALHAVIGVGLWASALNAQQLERSLVASSGAWATAGTIQVDQSLGDLVVRSFVSPGLIVNQGFQQTYDLSTSVLESESTDLRVYPNPTRDRITVEWLGSASAADVFLHDLLGQVLWTAHTALSGPLVIDLSERAPGAYFLRVVPDGEPMSVVRLEKVD